MAELIQKAIDTIDRQAEKINGSYAQIIASHIIDRYLKSESNARIIVEGKKTLSDCLSNIKNKAREEAENGVAAIADNVVFGWAVEYYGFSEETLKESKIIDIFDVI